MEVFGGCHSLLKFLVKNVVITTTLYVSPPTTPSWDNVRFMDARHSFPSFFLRNPPLLVPDHKYKPDRRSGTDTGPTDLHTFQTFLVSSLPCKHRKGCCARNAGFDVWFTCYANVWVVAETDFTQEGEFGRGGVLPLSFEGVFLYAA